jgi:glycerol-3-phosphate dehydrogenase (NAD(P)+)
VTRVAVLAAGSWGTAFGLVLADAGADVVLWARRPDVCDAITRRHVNPDYLPGIELPGSVWATDDPRLALDGAEFVVLALPAQTLRSLLTRWVPLLPSDCVVVSLIKGVELGTAKRMSQVISEVLAIGPERVLAVSGPNLAGEIAARLPAATVVACADESVAMRLQKTCMTPNFRPYTNRDVVGVELGGAVKNVIALAVGMAEGMGLGDNAKASIITRGLAETARLGVVLGAEQKTFSGLAGLGDLVATCASPLSRNHRFGVHVGRGCSVQQAATETKQTAEGVKTCEAILQLARAHGVDVPITEHVVAVVHDGLPPAEMVRSLMTRAARSEHDD